MAGRPHWMSTRTKTASLSKWRYRDSRKRIWSFGRNRFAIADAFHVGMAAKNTAELENATTTGAALQPGGADASRIIVAERIFSSYKQHTKRGFSMSQKLSPELQALVGRAMTDSAFRKSLQQDVRGTLKAENINLDEQTVASIEQVVRDQRAAHLGQQFDEMLLHRAAHAA